MGKSKKNKIKVDLTRKQPLDEQIVAGRVVKLKDRNKVRLRQEETNYVDAKSTKKILKQARQQKDEIDLDFGPTPSEAKAAGLFDLKGSLNDDGDSGSESEVELEEKDATAHDFFDDVKIDEDDEKALLMFQNKDGAKTRTLGDIIQDKINVKQSELQTQFSDTGSLKLDDIDPRVKEMYEGVREVLKRYRSGKVPKAFKIIPKLRNWEQILYITEPHNWTAAAVFQATRIFCSGLAQQMAQRFYNLVLLPRIRDDLAEFNKMNPYLYRSLKKSLFKPAAFMKGIIIPLLESGDCTLREALIFGSVLGSSAIPVLHAAACLLKICEMPYCGANSIFIRIFFEKRFALPYRVIDAAVFHFLKFQNDSRDLPTLWHQAFLVFVQIYKNDLSTEQREALYALLKKKSHFKITPEIRRELSAAICRDSELGETMNCDDELGDTSNMDF